MKAIVVENEFGTTILFPEHASTLNPREMMSWCETGGHSAASELWAQEQTLTSPEEAARASELYNRLHGTKLEVVQDLSLAADLNAVRAQELSRYYRLN